MAPSRERVLTALLFVNVWLQVFDGFATYAGLLAGYGEANPLVAATFPRVGVVPALVGFKAFACGCLVLIWALRRRSVLVTPALLATAAVYVACSVAPWSVALANRAETLLG